jgi:hypothetical protein
VVALDSLRGVEFEVKRCLVSWKENFISLRQGNSGLQAGEELPPPLKIMIVD